MRGLLASQGFSECVGDLERLGI